ncbi:ion channel [Tepidibacter hydrothermalis]|uniref:Ion channel n=1 Tax=Tepidibacter hydrothermalis TaxID=3036126 RepID=A0ABY8EJX7_9FIRM|nr:ion channel [Tepidibacter hydrothermalis]WFD11323.1 ion channel [Tepidibacter hydrothermalis]
MFAFVYIILNVFIYMMNELNSSTGETINYCFSSNLKDYIPTLEKLIDFGDCLYFSIMTFTTIGYGHFEDNGLVGRILIILKYFSV